MLHEDTLRWLNTLRPNERIKLKHIPITITHELLELGLARVRGGNLVITTAGLKGTAESNGPSTATKATA
jgi:hypothetical protein